MCAASSSWGGAAGRAQLLEAERCAGAGDAQLAVEHSTEATAAVWRIHDATRRITAAGAAPPALLALAAAAGAVQACAHKLPNGRVDAVGKLAGTAPLRRRR